MFTAGVDTLWLPRLFTLSIRDLWHSFLHILWHLLHFQQDYLRYLNGAASMKQENGTVRADGTNNHVSSSMVLNSWLLMSPIRFSLSVMLLYNLVALKWDLVENLQYFDTLSQSMTTRSQPNMPYCVTLNQCCLCKYAFRGT